jgi:nucleoside-diphosphate-sugar epimerase
LKSVLVTGGSGFIGCNLIRHLLSLNYTVLNLDVSPPRDASQNIFWKECDLRDFDVLSSLISKFGPNYVIHLAARTDLGGSTISDYVVNIDGTENLIRSIKDLDCLEKVLFASSRLVCKIGHNPSSVEEYSATTPYGLSKVEMEIGIRRLCDHADYDWLIFRPTSIWGPWFAEPYRDFFDVVMSGKYVHPIGVSVSKSFGYVGNTVFLLEKMISSGVPLARQTIYLSDYRNVDVLDWANDIRSKLMLSKIRRVPLLLLRFVAVIGSILSMLGVKRVPLTKFRLNNLMTDMHFDIEPLKAFAIELPFTVEDGIGRTLDWIRDQPS